MMHALTITHPDITRKKLLGLAEEIPGAWVGIRIAGFLLMLSGWPGTRVAELLGISRVNATKWCHKANAEGLSAVYDKPRPGRPSQFDNRTMKILDQALTHSPKNYGVERTRWDGKVVVEYLEKHHGISVHVRHAQRLIRKLGFSLRQPMYRFAQATNKGVAEHIQTIKKTPIRTGGRIAKGDSVR
jgi:transposase